MQRSAERTSRVPALDGVRGIAILMVLLGHIETFGDVPGTSALMKAVKLLMWSGLRGVDLFFVLSGFLITGILLDTKSAPNRAVAFYARRVLRIFPLYYLALTIAIISIAIWVPPALREHYPTVRGWISYFLYLNTWWMPVMEPARQMPIFTHFWTLAVEEQFYMIWPACVWLIPNRYLPKLCGALSIFAFCLRLFLDQHDRNSPLLSMVFTRMDSLLAGAFCALAIRDERLLAKARKALPWVALAALIGMPLLELSGGQMKSLQNMSGGYFAHAFSLSLLAAGFACFVLWSFLHSGTADPVDRTLSNPLLRIFGKYSYGIYVYHLPLFVGAHWLVRGQSWLGQSYGLSLLFCAALIAASFLVAFASYELFEKQMLRLKTYFVARPKPVAADVLVGSEAG